jgi:hypothetical protein
MTTAALAGPLLAGAGLLGVAGAAKVVRPHGTVRGLRQVGLPAAPSAVRALAAAEVVVALTAATVGGRIGAAGVAASYATFTVFVVTALARGWPLSSCGCFGEPDSPPSVAHVVVDAALALVAGAAAVAGGPAPIVLVSHRPGWGAAVVALAVVTAGLAQLALTRLPALRSPAWR